MAYSSEIEKLEKRWLENPKGRNFAPLADAYRKAGEVDKAVELCRSGLERHPDYVSAHIVYGRCLIDQKNDVGAEEVFRQVLSLDPENIIALKVLADLADRTGRPGEAVDWLSRLLAADPMNGDAEESLKHARTKAAAAKAAAPVPAPEPAPEPDLLELEDLAATEAPTAEPPLVEHDEVVLQAGSRSPDIETFDGDLGFTTAARRDDLIVEESEPLQPDGLSVEGLARTQYDGSGMFRLDAPEGPPAAEERSDQGGDGHDLGPASDLPLIMPDDHFVPSRRSSAATPAPVEPEPPRRTSRVSGGIPAAVSMSDDEGAVDAATLSAAEPVVTETMGDLYLQQGHREDALRVYRALLADRSGDARLGAKIRDLEAPVRPPKAATPPLESATAFLRRVWRGEPAPQPALPSRELTGALQAAFATAPRVSESYPDTGDSPGAPTQPAEDVISLDSVFGDQVGRGPVADRAPGNPAPEPPSSGTGGGGSPSGGFSFDDFFGAAPGAAETPARPAARGASRPSRPQPEDEDLDQFQSWLKGLKT